MKLFLKYTFIFTFTFFTLQLFGQKKKVACIGDSVTKGYGINDANKSYPSQLQRLLGDQYIVQNFGNSGSTLLSKGHKPYIKTEEYKKAMEFTPDIIVIALGLNDTDPRNWPNYGDSFVFDYSNLIADFKKINPKVEVFVCRLTPIFSGHKRFLSGTRDWFDEIQKLIPKITEANQAKLIDNHSPLAARIDLFQDFLHPDEQGAQIIAQSVYQSLVKVQSPLTIAKTFGNHMVLQRNVENTIFGNGTAGRAVHVHVAGKKYSTKVNTYGEWSVNLSPMKAGGPYTVDIQSESENILLQDVLFGDVYLSSGQSNMAFMLKQALRGKEWSEKAADYPQVRLFKNVNLAETNAVSWDSTVLQKVNDLNYFSGNWSISDPQSAANFSAIAYAFACEIATSQKIPVGLVDISVGGSNTESWIPRKVLENDNLLATYIHNWRNSDFIQDFCRDRGNQNLAHSKNPNQRHPYGPAYNYEAGISKWLKTKFTAVLWYQGESNAHNVELHDHLFKTLVHSWRDAFQQDLPYYFVQLSSIERPSWPVFRDHQRKLAETLPKVYMAVSSDLGSPQDVHPKEKIIIGQRLANLAKKYEYRIDIAADTPVLLKTKKKQDQVDLIFGNCKRLQTKDNAAIKGFEMVDDKGNVTEIKNVKILKNSVQFQALGENIVKIRYGYRAFTNANLENEIGTPVSTFSVLIK